MENALIESALKLVAGATPEGSRIILFGSQARGDANCASDIDILVIEPNAANPTAETIRLSTLLGKNLIPADVVVMSENRFEELRTIPNTLAYRVEREGREYGSGR